MVIFVVVALCVLKSLYLQLCTVYLDNSVYTELFALFSARFIRQPLMLRHHVALVSIQMSQATCYRFNIAAKASSEFVSAVRETVQLLSRAGAATTGCARGGALSIGPPEKNSGVPGGQSIYSTQPITGPSPAYSGLEVLQKHRR